MNGKDLLNQQLNGLQSVDAIVNEHVVNVAQLESTASKLTNDYASLSFRCNVEPDVLAAIVKAYEKANANPSVTDLEAGLNQGKSRASMFASYYAKQTGLPRKQVYEYLTECPVSMNYETYSAVLQEEISPSHGFFEVTNESGVTVTATKNDVPEERKNDYRERALSNGYPEELVERAIEQMTDTVTIYSQFESLMEKIVDADIEKEREQKAGNARLMKAIRNDLQKLWNDKNIVSTCATALYNTYNTTAVSPAELCEELRDSSELKLDIYRESIYSITHQVKRPFVADAVNACLAKWENSPVITGLINNYLDSIGVPEEEREANKKSLLKVLPDNIRSQTAPDVWKQYQAVCIITGRNLGAEADASADIFETQDSATDFAARMESYIDDGVPYDAAQRQAVEDYYQDISEEERLSIFGHAGKFVGKAIKFKYDAADSFNSLIEQSLGDKAPMYFEHREEIQARKQELKRIKQENKVAIQQAKLEKKLEQIKEPKPEIQREPKQHTTIGNGFGNARYQDTRYSSGYGQMGYGGYNQGSMFGRQRYGANSGYGYSGGNFAPRIPVFMMAILIHVIVALLCFLFFGVGKSIFPVAGLLLATFGFIRKRLNEPNAIVMIIAGYAVTVLAFWVSI